MSSAESLDSGPRRPKGSDHYNSPDYDNGTGPEREEVDREEIDRGRSDPNSPYYDNGTGPWPWEETDKERKDRDPSNPDSPNYEG